MYADGLHIDIAAVNVTKKPVKNTIVDLVI